MTGLSRPPDISARDVGAWAKIAAAAAILAVMAGVLTATEAGHAVAITLGFVWEFAKTAAAIVRDAFHEMKASS